MLTPEQIAEWIEVLKTEKGGWTRKGLAILGVPWPPPRGWRKRLLAEGQLRPQDLKPRRRRKISPWRQWRLKHQARLKKETRNVNTSMTPRLVQRDETKGRFPMKRQFTEPRQMIRPTKKAKPIRLKKIDRCLVVVKTMRHPMMERDIE